MPLYNNVCTNFNVGAVHRQYGYKCQPLGLTLMKTDIVAADYTTITDFILCMAFSL